MLGNDDLGGIDRGEIEDMKKEQENDNNGDGDYLKQAAETIMSMCTDFLMDKGPDERTFVSNLQMFADECRKHLPRPCEECIYQKAECKRFRWEHKKLCWQEGGWFHFRKKQEQPLCQPASPQLSTVRPSAETSVRPSI